MTEPLRSCPFCGRKALMCKRAYHLQQQPRELFGAVCGNGHCCGGRVGCLWLTETEAVYAWNRRAGEKEASNVDM